jgi:dethiobiotin synthetase
MPDTGAGGRGIFVTGTDTGVGKTFVAAALLRGICAEGRRAVAMKPVACGIEPGEAHHCDLAALIAAGNVVASAIDMNPYAFERPIAPHLAAQQAGVVIDLGRIAGAYARLSACAEVVVVEGAGGALVPLTERLDMLDIAARLCLPVLLVVGIRLGCINHALLTTQAINARGVRLAGWVANRIDSTMLATDANVDALRRRLPAPLVADLPWLQECDIRPALRGASLVALGLSRWNHDKI